MELLFSQEMEKEKLIALQKDYAYLQNEIQNTENAWLEMSETLQNLN